MTDESIDEAIDEISKRVEALEMLYFGDADECLNDEEAVQNPENNQTAWDTLVKLETQISSYEDMLSSSVDSALVEGAECLAFSIADGQWRDATFPAGHGRWRSDRQ